MSPLTVTIVVVVVVAAALASATAITRLRAGDPSRPWWSYPAMWLGIGTAVTLVGAILAPRLLGFTFVLLPLLWMRGPGRRSPRGTHPADDDR